MLGWFHAIMPKEERFFDLFARHSQAVVAGAEALRAMLEGGDAVPRHYRTIMDREQDADNVTRDVLIAGNIERIADLRRGAIVGTSALRRRAQLLYRRPDLEIVTLRGNVDTRLAKRDAGLVEATILALAGLKRLNMAHVGTPISDDEMLPAVGQGTVCIECRADDERIRAWLAAIDHAPTATCVGAEHALLAVLDGSCRTPIAGHAMLVSDGNLHLRALIAKPDGSALIATERRGPASDGKAMGHDAAQELIRRGGPGFLST